jgi:NOL1/NOP2/sun family putative RNA methylase
MKFKAQGILPKQLIERLKILYDPKTCDLVFHAFETTRPTTIRVNSLKASRKEIEQELSDHGILYDMVPWFLECMITHVSLKSEIQQLDSYKTGRLYIQSLSSMMPPIILDPKPNQKILDLCAAPGSKTTQIAAMMQNTGEIIANDSSTIRLEKLKSNIKTLGVTNTKAIHSYGQRLWEQYPQYFDGALVDVACTMEGRITLSDPKSYQYWSTQKVKELSHIDQWLLRSAISTVKPGGVIVYSTCTLAPEENEGVVDWILKKEKDSLELLEIDISHAPLIPGFMKWKEKIFHKDMQKTKRILPDGVMEGFYIAKFRKTSSNIKTSN